MLCRVTQAVCDLYGAYSSIFIQDTRPWHCANNKVSRTKYPGIQVKNCQITPLQIIVSAECNTHYLNICPLFNYTCIIYCVHRRFDDALYQIYLSLFLPFDMDKFNIKVFICVPREI